MNRVVVDGWVRVTKRAARKLYDLGETVRVLPVKVWVGNNMFALEINKNDKFEVEPFDWELFFDTRVNRFEYYNCQYNELGKYSAFYVRKEVLS